MDEKLVNSSFYITYSFLVTTATITFIEAMRTKNAQVRHILNLETCISIVATYFYGIFLEKLKKEKIDYKEINTTRYVDWSITTPIMLLVLLLAFGYNTGQKVTLWSFLLVLVLNYGMLYSGYVGETGQMDKKIANLIGFVFFFLMFGYIYLVYIAPYKSFDNKMLYLVFLVLWTLYGVVYYFEEIEKNVSYNILDLFAKCFVGIFFWAYFTKALVL